ncbi:hypothetical protein SKAU_G00253170 [Synaphobranchus kaupii]|uniref:Uncharacterized protein n=1 Tax=Synaphobranchus kaupii TaxID=118154 RepID=A0A9Q1F387_SYNKA|nr:hypothetical protein SKAU_G00253170 [Synaphobranchus kaupii]
MVTFQIDASWGPAPSLRRHADRTHKSHVPFLKGNQQELIGQGCQMVRPGDVLTSAGLPLLSAGARTHRNRIDLSACWAFFITTPKLNYTCAAGLKGKCETHSTVCSLNVEPSQLLEIESVPRI